MSLSIKGEYNITFLHIPKTAGTSIRQWLHENKGNSSEIPWEFLPKLSTIKKKQLNDTVFTVVRNPWDRMVSIYFFLQSSYIKEKLGKRNTDDILTINKNIENVKELCGISFNKFVEKINNFNNFYGYKNWYRVAEPQMSWLDFNTDFILKFENLNQDFKKVQNMFNNYNPLPVLNNTVHDFYKLYYNTDTKKIVAKLYSKEIDLFKYTF